MNISSVRNISGSFQKINRKQPNNTQINKDSGKNTPSFKSIYVEDIVELGDVAKSNEPPEFLPKDALLLNEIANQYPYQDCFIMKGYAGLPRLEYREKPPEVQIFYSTLAKNYRIDLEPNNEKYPSEPLLLYGDSALNRYIGMTSFVSLNPSLPYTVKIGYELHKKLIKKKEEILEMIGKTDDFDLGDDTIIQRAHKEIKDVELAVTRYLMEASYAFLTDPASAKQIYKSNYPKVQSRLTEKRKYDLTTSIAKRPVLSLEDLDNKEIDICDLAVKNFPNERENKERIEELTRYLREHGIVLG